MCTRVYMEWFGEKKDALFSWAWRKAFMCVWMSGKKEVKLRALKQAVSKGRWTKTQKRAPVPSDPLKPINWFKTCNFCGNTYWDKGNHEEQSRLLIFYLFKTNVFPLLSTKSIHQKSWERSLQFSSKEWHSGEKDGTTGEMLSIKKQRDLTSSYLAVQNKGWKEFWECTVGWGISRTRMKSKRNQAGQCS